MRQERELEGCCEGERFAERGLGNSWEFGEECVGLYVRGSFGERGKRALDARKRKGGHLQVNACRSACEPPVNLLTKELVRSLDRMIRGLELF